MKKLPRFPFPGAIDADGHVLEPPDMWDRYMEPAYHSRGMQIRQDDQGLEYLEIDGRPSKVITKGFPLGVAAMDMVAGFDFGREPTGNRYIDMASFGAMYPQERLKRLDMENIERTLLYPTLGVLWEAECEDLDLAQAYVRAYNRWIIDFCSDSGDRLVPIAQVSMGIPEAAEAEVRRAAEEGAKGIWCAPFVMTRKPLGHPDHHRVFATAAELGLPFAIHPSFEPRWAAPGRMGDFTSRKYQFFLNVVATDAVRHAFTSMFQFGVFDLIPELKLIVLETGASWIGYWLDRMDSLYESPLGAGVPLKEKPSTYFKKQCWISADPDESTLRGVMDVVGPDRFFWASDFPHPDHPPDYVTHMTAQIEALPEAQRAGILGRNCIAAYNL